MSVGCAAVLFSRFGSSEDAVTVARFTIVPGAGKALSTRTVTPMVAFAPLGMSPRSHAIGPCPLQLPWLDVIDSSVTPVGRSSVSWTPIAGDGPLLVTISVYSTDVPATAASGESNL